MDAADELVYLLRVLTVERRPRVDRLDERVGDDAFLIGEAVVACDGAHLGEPDAGGLLDRHRGGLPTVLGDGDVGAFAFLLADRTDGR